MRQQLIEALTFPKLLVQGLIEEGNFPHKNLYAATGERCHHCDMNGECTWEQCLQDFRSVDHESTESLSDALREGTALAPEGIALTSENAMAQRPLHIQRDADAKMISNRKNRLAMMS